jgi:predicted Zn-dependent protease
MKRIVTILVFAAMMTSCARNAITGRTQLSLVSDAELAAMAETQYRQFLNTHSVVPAGNANADMVKRVGSRIAAAVRQYYADHGEPNALNNYNWEFNLVNSNEINAWCMPGGKVVIYTGILPVTQTEAGLAIVMAHEITHAVVGHGKERMSQDLAAQGIGALGGAALGGTKAAGIFNAAYGVGAEYGVLLPFSRKQETEADHYGLIFAAAAGYDPRVAIDFWTRMANLGSGGQKPPPILSDHPSDAQRIQAIRDLMPEALKYYNPR